SVKTAAKGIVLDGASDNVIEGVLVRDIGGEGVHFRTHSSGNILRKSEVRDVGKSTPGMGEAVYVGSAVSNWGQYTNGKPDKSDENQILGNKLGPNVGAELIDIKEGTTGTLVQGNTFDGAGMSGDNYADSWMDVKGNNARITGNTGTNALKDGFQTHVAAPGWGQGNVFRSNIVKVKSSGYGFSVTSGNKVYCDNTVQEAGKGFANVACTK
ncbi:MAG: coagulation factor 5/8 type domain-containing protein, partial [Byssovorax sp.]